jgi:hypothetical protein
VARERSERLAGRPLLAALLAAGALLRLARLDAHSFWGDEGWTLEVVHGSAADVVRRCAADVHPPLYFLIVRPLVELRVHEVSARLPSALASIVMLVILVGIARRHLSSAALVLFTAWAAASPYLLQPAREARPYALLGALAAAWLASLDRYRRDPDRFGTGSGLLLAAVSAALAYTHHFGWLLVAAGPVAALAVAPRAAWRWLLASLLALALALPAAAALARQVVVRAPKSYGMTQRIKRALGVPVQMVAGYHLANMSGEELAARARDPAAIAFLAGAAALLALAAAGMARDPARTDPAGRMLLAACAVPVALAAAGDFSHFTARYLVVVAPAFMLLVVRSCSRLPPAGFRAACAALAVACAVSLASLSGATTDPIHREDWRSLGQHVAARARPGDSVWVKAGAGTRFLYGYYGPGPPGPALVPDAPGESRGPADALPACGATAGARLWVVLGRSSGLDLSPPALGAHVRRLERATGLARRGAPASFGRDLVLVELAAGGR